jgi:hypothetical protein
VNYQLFIAVDVLEFIERLPRKTRLGKRAVVSEIGADPIDLSGAVEI